MNFDARQGSTLLNTYNLEVVVSVDDTGTLSTTHEIKGTDTIGYIEILLILLIMLIGT